MTPSYDVSELAREVGGELRGSRADPIRGVAGLDSAQTDQASWVESEKYAETLRASKAGVVLIRAEFGPTPMPAILCPDLEKSVSLLLALFASCRSGSERGIHSTAVVHPESRLSGTVTVGPHVVVDRGATIGDGTVLHAGVHVGGEAVIGAGCVLWNHVVVRDRCILGDRVVLQSGVVIGSDGFGFYFSEGGHRRYPHIGIVTLEDDVEIGAGSTVDRAKLGTTRIGRGTKIDNLVHVGHNVDIGARCILLAGIVLGGSAVLKDGVVISGNAAVSDHVVIGKGAQMAGLSVAWKDIADGGVWSGIPARDHRQQLRSQVAVQRLPELERRVRELTQRLTKLEAATDHPQSG